MEAAESPKQPCPPACLEEVPRIAPPPKRKPQGPPPASLHVGELPKYSPARPMAVPDLQQLQQRIKEITTAGSENNASDKQIPQNRGPMPMPVFDFSSSRPSFEPLPRAPQPPCAEDVLITYLEGLAVGVAVGVAGVLLYRWLRPSPAALVKVSKKAAKAAKDLQ